MFPLTITLHTPAQLNAVLAAIGAGVEALSNTAAPAPVAQPAPEKAKTDPKPEAAPVSEPTPTVSDTSASSSNESKPAAESENSAPTEPSTVTYEDAKAAVVQVSKARDRNAAVGLLQRFGVSKLPELLPEHYGALVAHANAILAGGEV